MYIEKEQVDEKTRKKLEELLEGRYHRYWRQKRTFDIVSSIIILVITAPLWIIISLSIVLDDPHAGPFYKQLRVGRHGKEFYMYKFRTMYKDADKRRDELNSQNEMTGPVFKIKNDPRITHVGKLLRKFSIDEIAQFINVFKGDMSIVGPRPPLPCEVAEYTDYDKLRLIVTPGITCDWQISKNRNDITFEKWVEMDLEYIAHRTIWRDISIILKTPFSMLGGTGR